MLGLPYTDAFKMRSSNYGIFLPAVSAVGLATLLFQSVFLTGLIDAKPTPVPQLGAVQQGAFESGCNTCWNRARNAPFSNEIIAKSVGSADHPGIVEYVLVGLVSEFHSKAARDTPWDILWQCQNCIKPALMRC